MLINYCLNKGGAYKFCLLNLSQTAKCWSYNRPNITEVYLLSVLLLEMMV